MTSPRDEGPARALRPSAESRVGTTFVLLMQVRTLMVGVTVLFEEDVRNDPWALAVLAVAALTSVAVVVYWERLVPVLISRPTLLAFDVLLGYAVLKAGGVFGTYFLFTVVTAGLAGLLYRWPVAVVLCVQQTALYFAALQQSDVPDGLRADRFPLLVGMPAFYLIGASLGFVLRRLFEEHAAAEEARWRIAGLALATDERSRLAREMHDSLNGTLAGIGLAAKGLPLWVRKSPERAEAEALKIAEAVEVASRDARALIADLREGAVAEPLGVVVGRLAGDWSQASGVAVRTAFSTVAEPLPAARHEAVAVVRESLANIARHSGATAVEIRMARYGDRLEISVRDDGRGLPVRPRGVLWLDSLTAGGHYGIVGMHERAERAGGTLSVDSDLGAGTKILLSLPVDVSGPAAAARRGRRRASARRLSHAISGRGR